MSDESSVSTQFTFPAGRNGSDGARSAPVGQQLVCYLFGAHVAQGSCHPDGTAGAVQEMLFISREAVFDG